MAWLLVWIYVALILSTTCTPLLEPKIPNTVFPFHEFFNTSSDAWITYAQSTFSCEGKRSCCSCGDDCMMYGICCIDKFWKEHRLNIFKDTYESFFMKRFIEADVRLECVEVFPDVRSNGHQADSYMMIASCPSGTNSTGQNSCRDTTHDQFELTVVGDDGFLYQNAKCAKCNFVSGFRQLDYKVFCQGQSNITNKSFMNLSLKLLKNCTFALKLPKNAKTKLCSPSDYCTPQSDSKEMDNLCTMYFAPILGYKNYHCALCHSAKNVFAQNPQWGKCMHMTWGARTRWSVLIDLFRANTGPRVHFEKVKKKQTMHRIADFKCRNTSIDSDSIHLPCLAIECPSGYLKVNSSCSKVLSAFHIPYGQELPRCFYSKAKSVSLIQSTRSSTTLINATLQNLFNTSVFRVDENDNQLLLKLSEDGIEKFLSKLSQSFDSVEPLFKEVSQIVISPHLSASLKWLHYEEWLNQNLFPGERICESMFQVDSKDSELSESCDVLLGNKTVPYSSLAFIATLDQYSTTLFVKGCRKFYSKLLCIQRHSVPLYQQAEMLKHGYVFCKVKKVGWARDVSLLDGYMSFIGTVISIVCYALSLITFKLFPEILPFGLVCLCISLLLSDSLYLVASGLYATSTAVSTDLCKGVAIVIHLGVVLVQSSSVLSAIDIATSFGVLRPTQARNREQNPFKKYLSKRLPILISFSFTVVMVAFMLDQQDVVDMGYGKRGACLFNGYYGRLLFYVVPNIISMSFTLSLVIFTLHKINKQNEQSKRSLKLSNTSNRPTVDVAKIALKLVFAYGLSEVVGFVQVPWDSEMAKMVNTCFGVLYNILRSLRGVVIFVVYLCKTHVYRLITGRIWHSWVGEEKKSTGKEISSGNTEIKDSKHSGKVNSKNTRDNKIGYQNWSYPIVDQNAIELDERNYEMTTGSAYVIEPYELKPSNTNNN